MKQKNQSQRPSSDKTNMHKIKRKILLLTASHLHLDHIEPLNASDCCGLETGCNLQLLGSFQNMQKGNRRTYKTYMDKLLANETPHRRYTPQPT